MSREEFFNESGGALASAPIELITAGTVASECHVARRTIGRWILDSAIGFPPPVEINRRLYFRRHEVEDWKRSRQAASLPGARGAR